MSSFPDPEEKLCPVCGAPMEYDPFTHWTGMRYVLVSHRWRHVESDGNGNRHFVEINKAAKA